MTSNKKQHAVYELLMAAKQHLKNGKELKALQYLEQIQQVEMDNMDEKTLFIKAAILKEELQEKRAKRKSRWTILLLFSGLLFLVVLFNYCRVYSTSVEARLSVDQLTFKLSKPWHLYDISVKRLGISMPTDLSLDIESLEEAVRKSSIEQWKHLAHNGTLNINRQSENLTINLNSTYLKINQIVVDSGTVVKLNYQSHPEKHLSISFFNAQSKISIYSPDTLYIIGSNFSFKDHSEFTESHKLRTKLFNEHIELKSNAYMRLDFNLPSNTSNLRDIMAGTLHIDSITFTKPIGNDEQSTILNDGIIYLSELNNKQIPIKANDFLKLQKLKSFTIRSIRLEDQLQLQMEGKTGLLEAGTSIFRSNLLPSWLEWIYNNQAILLIISTLIPVFSFVIAWLNRLMLLNKD